MSRKCNVSKPEPPLSNPERALKEILSTGDRVKSTQWRAKKSYAAASEHKNCYALGVYMCMCNTIQYIQRDPVCRAALRHARSEIKSPNRSSLRRKSRPDKPSNILHFILSIYGLFSAGDTKSLEVPCKAIMGSEYSKLSAKVKFVHST